MINPFVSIHEVLLISTTSKLDPYYEDLFFAKPYLFDKWR